MKKILLLLLLAVSFTATAQIGVYRPYRTNGSVMVADSALFVGFFKIPSYTTFSVGGYADKAGANFGLNLTSSRLNVRGASSTTLEFPNLTEVNSLIAATPTRTLTQVLTAGNTSTLGMNLTGNVNIGSTSNGTEKLEVIGNFKLNGTNSIFKFGSGNVASNLNIDNTDATTTSATVRLFRSTNSTVAGFFDIYRGDGSATVQHSFSNRGSSFVNLSSGGFGVGTNAVSATNKLQVAGQVGISQFLGGNAAADSLVVHNSADGKLKVISPTYFAPLTSPTFTGTPILPTGTIAVTQAATDNSTKVATTALVVGATKEIVLNKTANYTVLVSDFANTGQITVYVDATSGNLDITIPSVATLLGYTLNVVKTDVSANTVTITGSANINGASTKVLSTQYEFVQIHSNNTQYYAK